MALDFRHKPSTDFAPVAELSRRAAAEEAGALREGIRHHDYLYYVKARPAISDAVYDRLFHRLEALEEAFPDLQHPDSPTQRVGAEPVGQLDKVRHRVPLLSLQAALEEREVEGFDDFVRRQTGREQIRYALEPKFDGFSVKLVYEGGHFSYGATRGNGEVGEDISHNLRTIGAIPLVLHAEDGVPDVLAVRGEVFMPRQGFLEMNQARVQRGEEPFANPRNAAAGSMRQLDPRNVADKPLDIYFFDLLEIEGQPAPPTQAELLQRLEEWGLRTCPLNELADSLEHVKRYHARLAEQRDDLEYEADGVVIKVDEMALRDELGYRARNPRWALAWKFPPREEVTTLARIVVSVGRTGTLTPVALLQPVDVGGVTVSRATLHNADEVERKDVRAGDRVRIIRAGDVIPEVLERIAEPGRQRGPEFRMPERCPVCDTPVVREGAYYVCPAGLSCPAQLVGAITHYGSRDAMDIGQLGEKTARQLVERRMVADLADLYALDAGDFQTLDLFAEKSAGQLAEAIRATRRPRLDRFLFALGIRHVGQRMARVLAEHYGSLEAVENATEEDLQQVPEIGPEIAASVAHFFANPRTRDILERMRAAGVAVQPLRAGAGDGAPLQGRTFVFTGALEHYSRKEAAERVEALGGRATSSVSRQTDYVVVGENPGSKADQARRYGVQVLDEAAFRDLLEQTR